MVTEARSIAVRILAPEAERRRQLVDEARVSLLSRPRELSPKWFYDERGSMLFDEITRLPEYYLTGREREILVRRSPEIAELTNARLLIELGSGTSEKTRLLLDALTEGGSLERFVPVDVSASTLAASAAALATEYPDVLVEPVAGDFEHHLSDLPNGSRRLIAFLGSTIGNLLPDARSRFLTEVGGLLGPEDALLVGLDLVKDERRLLDAYDDAHRVTAAFNRNVLRVLNRELGADFSPSAFDHVVRWDRAHEWIEMHLRAQKRQRVTVEALAAALQLEAGETIRTEISQKFRLDRFSDELALAGLRPAASWQDDHGDFALVLAFGS